MFSLARESVIQRLERDMTFSGLIEVFERLPKYDIQTSNVNTQINKFKLHCYLIHLFIQQLRSSVNSTYIDIISYNNYPLWL
jgi:hypothetical protein